MIEWLYLPFHLFYDFLLFFTFTVRDVFHFAWDSLAESYASIDHLALNATRPETEWLNMGDWSGVR